MAGNIFLNAEKEGSETMSAFSMQLTGTFLVGGGLLFFILTQILLNKWERAYRSETMQGPG